jgi:PAS domain S-box-containing protein
MLAKWKDLWRRLTPPTANIDSEPRLLGIFNKHAAVMLLIDPASGHIVNANLAAELFYGYPVSRLRAMNVTDLNISPPEQLQLQGQQALQTERTYFTFPHRLANGDIRTVEVQTSPVTINNRQLLLSVIHDVTSHEQVTSALLARTRELTTLQATLLDITSPQPLSTLLNNIVKRAAMLLQASSGGMYLTEPERRRVRCVVSYNTPSDFTGTVLNYGEGAAGTVAQTEEPIIIDDYRTWSGRAKVFEDKRPFQTVISAPLLWQGNVTGVIHVLREDFSQPFSQENLDLLMTFANHAAVAVEKARLRSELEQELTERKQAEAERERLIEELQTALSEVKKLGGLLPICASCHKIRDDEGYWQDVAVYIRDHSEAEFSHGICPDCMETLYPKLFMNDSRKKDS